MNHRLAKLDRELLNDGMLFEVLQQTKTNGQIFVSKSPADALHGGRIIYSLGVDLDDGMIPIIDGEHEPMPYVDNLHVYAEKPEPPTSDTDVPEGFTAIGTIKVMPGDAHDLANIPTEPGLYRAATGSTWYYDGKSWTPITDHNGEYTYAQKQSYKRFIETSLASHRLPFTPVSLPEYLVALGLAVLILPVVEAVKWVRRRRTPAV